MKHKLNVIKLTLMMLTTVFLIITTTFAWFMMIKKTEPLIIETGSLRSNTKLYYGLDINYDGILDDDTYLEVEAGGIAFSKVIPGQVYTFRLVIDNIGTLPGTLKIFMTNINTSNDIMFSAFEIRSTQINESILINDSTVSILENYILNDKETLQFDFIIYAKDNISDNYKNHYLVIPSFIIQLDQIQEY